MTARFTSMKEDPDETSHSKSTTASNQKMTHYLTYSAYSRLQEIAKISIPITPPVV